LLGSFRSGCGLRILEPLHAALTCDVASRRDRFEPVASAG
jgi:hypothetical protein